LGLLPFGTGSDFRRSIGFTTDADALKAILNPSTTMLDAGYAEFIDETGKQSSRYFLNAATIGFGAEVAGSVNRWREKLPRWVGGRVRFLAAAIRALDRFRNVPAVVALDDGRKVDIDTNLIVVANGRFAGGGMMLAPNASLDDGLFDVVLTDRATRIDVIKELPGVKRGSYIKNPKVREIRTAELSLTAERPLPIELDGEMVGYTPARFVLFPSAVRFAC
jgi:YegS/Rv2252/BmrU family lipid kinase